MRRLFIFLSLCIAANALAQSQKPDPAPPINAEKKEQKNNPYYSPSSSYKQGTKDSPFVVDVLPTPKTKEEADRDTKQQEQRTRNERIGRIGIVANIVLSVLLVIANGALFVYTAKSANAARDSADYAGKSATPLLMPYALTYGFVLHPIERIPAPVQYQAKLLLSFDNYGATPATIKEFRGQLLFSVCDEVPSGISLSTATPIHYNVIIPGGFRAKDLTTGALEFPQEITLTHDALDEILNDAEANVRYRRPVLIGEVIYDDIFGFRHWRKFCLKFRVMPQRTHYRIEKRGFYAIGEKLQLGLFQIAQGPGEYNTVKTEKIPNPDTL